MAVTEEKKLINLPGLRKFKTENDAKRTTEITAAVNAAIEALKGQGVGADYDTLKKLEDALKAIQGGNGATTLASLQAAVDLLNGTSEQDGSVRKAIKDLIGSAPEALDTLGEIATALNNDASLAATLTQEIATKAATTDVAATYATKTELAALAGSTPEGQDAATVEGNAAAIAALKGTTPQGQTPATVEGNAAAIAAFVPVTEAEILALFEDAAQG